MKELKGTKRILSIDMDYFVDAPLEVRNLKFPDGMDRVPTDMLKGMWDEAYHRYPEIKDIGLIPAYGEFMQYLDLLYRKKAIIRQSFATVSETHADIMNMLIKIPADEDVDLKHIDFHHDNYITGGDTCDCANWLRIYMNKREESGSSTTVTWYKRPDSETTSLTGTFPYKMKDEPDEELYAADGYDYIFLCYSPEWTPPHLRGYYEEMVKKVTSI